MCGILGIWNLDGRAIDLEALERATTTVRHRGPDDEGYLLVDTRTARTESCAGRETDVRLKLPRLREFGAARFDFGFGFRRLSIQDLSSAGHQPMASSDGRYWIVFNGEIYNYLELRAELISKGVRFHSGTDTEVILAAYQQWGEESLQRFNGMWAFVIWDAAAKTLFASRDRFGEKPLHYICVPGKMFAFASEMKSLWASGIAGRNVHQDTLELYTQYGSLDAGEQTLYENILRLPQAHALTLTQNGVLRKWRYWDIDPREQIEGKPDAWYSDQFREIFTDSVRIRLRSDVPIGSSLSGGLDSSSIVAVINKLMPSNGVQKTFSARFDDPAADEGRWIDKIVNSHRVEGHEVWPTGERMFEELEQLFWHQEEPFASSSIYAQWCVMRLAKENHVTVLLDGQGADEMLAGYHTYFDDMSDDLLKSLKLLSYFRLNRDCEALHGRTPGSVRRVVRQILPKQVKRPVKQIFNAMRSVRNIDPGYPTYPIEFKNVSGLRKILWWNTTRHGLNQLLRYADRNSMAHSREVRMPFLDHRLAEFVFTLPESWLHRHGWTKWILRVALRGILPEPIAQRVDKLAFMPPERRWLGPLVWKDIMLEQLAAGGTSAPLVSEPCIEAAELKVS